MNTIQLRAFNLVQGAAILGTPTSPLSLQTGRAYVVVEVDRDADHEIVTAQLRPLDPSIHGPFQQRFDYCEPVELLGLVVNAADPDDDDTGVETRPRLAEVVARSQRSSVTDPTWRADYSRTTGPCPCACNSGGFCGGCGHAGCGGRR